MSEVLHVQERNALGKRNNRKLRKAGRIPAVIYGHGQDPISLSVPADEFDAAIRHGAKIVDLQGAVVGQALLQDIQWDTFFQHVLHVDLLRVEAGDTVTVTVLVEMRGSAPGANEGVVEQLIHELEIEVKPADVPEKLHLNVNQLELGKSLHVSDIEDMPAGANLTTHAADDVVVQCTERVEIADEELVSVGEVEPEVIGQKEDESEEEGGD